MFASRGPCRSVRREERLQRSTVSRPRKGTLKLGLDGRPTGFAPQKLSGAHPCAPFVPALYRPQVALRRDGV